jgi:hypothetical protein
MLDGNGASLTDRCVCWCWLDWRLRDGFADIRAGRHVTGYLGRRGDMGLQFGVRRHFKLPWPMQPAMAPTLRNPRW